MQNEPLFNRRKLVRNRERALSTQARHGFVLEEASRRLFDRLLDVERKFHRILIIGGPLPYNLSQFIPNLGQCDIWFCDLSLPLLKSQLKSIDQRIEPGSDERDRTHFVVADSEKLPFDAERFDLILSVMDMHWVNDLPGTLAQIHRCLLQDGLFLAAFFGGDTLFEVRQSLMEAELEMRGGVSPRVSPMVDIRDGGALLQRAGFGLPVTDLDRITCLYDSTLSLLREIRGMGQNSALSAHSPGLRFSTLVRLDEIYRQRFGTSEGKIPATFEIVTFTGWRPHPDQQKPMQPGSGEISLEEALKSSKDST